MINILKINRLTTNKEIADALSLQYDSDGDFIYMNDNRNVGLTTEQSGAYRYLYPVVNGVADTGMHCGFATALNGDAAAPLSYIRTQDGIFIGLGDTGTTLRKLTMGIIKIKYLDTGEEGQACWGYRLAQGMVNLYTDRGNYMNITSSENLPVLDGEYVLLSPLFIPKLAVVSEKTYIPKYFDDFARCVEFSMNGDNYVTSTANKSGDVRIVAKV